jgi:hypothetical protein
MNDTFCDWCLERIENKECSIHGMRLNAIIIESDDDEDSHNQMRDEIGWGPGYGQGAP